MWSDAAPRAVAVAVGHAPAPAAPAHATAPRARTHPRTAVLSHPEDLRRRRSPATTPSPDQKGTYNTVVPVYLIEVNLQIPHTKNSHWSYKNHLKNIKILELSTVDTYDTVVLFYYQGVCYIMCIKVYKSNKNLHKFESLRQYFIL